MGLGSPRVKKQDVGSCWFNSGFRARQSIVPTRAISQAIAELMFPGRGPRPGPSVKSVEQVGSVMWNLPVI